MPIALAQILKILKVKNANDVRLRLRFTDREVEIAIDKWTNFLFSGTKLLEKVTVLDLILDHSTEFSSKYLVRFLDLFSNVQYLELSLCKLEFTLDSCNESYSLHLNQLRFLFVKHRHLTLEQVDCVVNIFTILSKFVKTGVNNFQMINQFVELFSTRLDVAL